jgi:hypothetical protein
MLYCAQDASILEWRDRVTKSVLLREWNGWEERELHETPVRFYRNVGHPSLVHGHQWHPPENWPFEVNETRAGTHVATSTTVGEVEATKEEEEVAVEETTSTKAKSGLEKEIATADEIDMNNMVTKLAENETFLALLRAKLGLPPPQRETKKDVGNKKGSYDPSSSSSEDESDRDDDDETIAAQVLRSMERDISSEQDVITSVSVKRLARLQIAKQRPQLHPVTPGEGWKRLKPSRLPRTFAKKVYSTTVSGPGVRI